MNVITTELGGVVTFNYGQSHPCDLTAIQISHCQHLHARRIVSSAMALQLAAPTTIQPRRKGIGIAGKYFR